MVGRVSEGWKGPRRMLLFAGSVEDATPREPGQSEWEAGCCMGIESCCSGTRGHAAASAGMEVTDGCRCFRTGEYYYIVFKKIKKFSPVSLRMWSESSMAAAKFSHSGQLATDIVTCDSKRRMNHGYNCVGYYDL